MCVVRCSEASLPVASWIVWWQGNVNCRLWGQLQGLTTLLQSALETTLWGEWLRNLLRAICFSSSEPGLVRMGPLGHPHCTAVVLRPSSGSLAFFTPTLPTLESTSGT